MRFLVNESTWNAVSLSQSLQRAGILVTRCDSIDTLTLFLQMGQQDLIVLDARDLVGSDVTLADLRRSHPDLPICLLAAKPTSAEMARWLNTGVATVIDRAAPLPEIHVRLQAVARRALGLAGPVVRLGSLTIDVATRHVAVMGRPTSLAPKLYEILEYLALRRNRVISRNMLMSHVYAFEKEPCDRIFSVYLCQLRALLAPMRDQLCIETVRGEGYRMVKLDRQALAA